MKLRRLFVMAAGSLAVLAVPLAAQVHQRIAQTAAAGVTGVAAGPGAPVWVGGGNTFDFIAAGPAFSGEMVTGAPYSAEAVTETQQTLADGNRISRTNSSKIYRDSQGRTRREQTIGALGPWASAGEPVEMVFVNDPVAGVSYVINTKERTAQKTEIHPIKIIEGKAEDVHVEKDVLHWKTEPAEAGAPTQVIIRRGHHEAKHAEEAETHDVTVMHAAVSTAFNFSDDNMKTESLGKQMIDGVEADGTRTTITIPAGQIGNERPIEIVSESWYSSQLKTLVLSKQNDPRMGETTYRLTNIQLVEPLPSMFEVPAGYTVQEGPNMRYFEQKISPAGEGQAEPGR